MLLYYTVYNIRNRIEFITSSARKHERNTGEVTPVANFKIYKLINLKRYYNLNRL